MILHVPFSFFLPKSNDKMSGKFQLTLISKIPTVNLQERKKSPIFLSLSVVKDKEPALKVIILFL